MIEDYFFTKNTRWVLWGAFTSIVALLIFHAGVVVGSHQHLRERPGANGAPVGMLGGIMPPQGFVESGHGAVGTVASVTLPTFTLQTRDGMLEKVETGSSTVVTGGSTGLASDLTSGEKVIIIGDPAEVDDQDDLDARIIHILPSPAAPAPQNPQQ